MANLRLRNGLLAAGLTRSSLAQQVDVDEKTVERWITRNRIPHPNTRARVVQVLGQDETYYWPELLGTEQARNTTEAELVHMWPTRSSVPGDVWTVLFKQATSDIDVLVYSGGFLVEAYDLVEVIRSKAAAGVSFRILLGDSRCEAVRQRGKEEGLPTLPERCRSTLEYLGEVANLPGVQIRTHRTVLYASLFRFDESMMVNTHTYGAYAARSPVLHLRRVPGGQLFDYYNRAYDRVWAAGEEVITR
jgi:transcriptional regulator with XRE-family HTH domain